MSLRALALAVVLILVVVAIVCYRQSRPALEKVGLWPFLSGSDWDPVQDSFGALPFLYGTVVTSLLAMAIAIPIALGLALFLTEMAPARLRRPIAYLVELLAAIPSVIYGLWALMVLVPLLRSTVEPLLGRALGFSPLFTGPPIGLGYLAAGLVLAIMVLPTIASITIEVLRTVPASLKEGALALGATRWETIRLSVLPHARRGILGAVLLGLGRALGETMAVLRLQKVNVVCGNQPEIHASLFSPGYSLPSVIANEFAEAIGPVHTGALAGLALVLLGVTLLVSIGARLLVRLSARSLGAT